MVYANALAIELERYAISFQREHRIAVIYEGVIVGDYVADFVLGNEWVVELIAVEALSTQHSLQLVNYLSATRFEQGLLLNFGAKSLEFRTKSRLYPRTERVRDAVGTPFGNSVNSV
jgi:GxxExxY protein